MKKTLTALLTALALTLGLSASASAASNPQQGACFAQFASDPDSDVGATISVLAHELRPFGTSLPAFIPGFKCPEA